jgi:phosphoglycerate dehydrogenase-like enzyme
MPTKPVVAVLISRKMQEQMFTDAARSEFVERFDVRWPDAEEKVTPEQVVELLRGAEGCYGGWGMPALNEKTLVHAERLRILAYSAGSVKGLVGDEVWKRGIVVTSAAADNAVDVAHYTLGVMLLSVKNYIELSSSGVKKSWWGRDGHRPPDDFRGCTVGIIAASYIGKLVLKLLEPFGVERLLYDPYVTAEQARALGAEKVELDEIFRRSDIVSLHAPNIPETRHLVNAQRLALMKDGAAFINTSRGALVDETALVAELQHRRIWAYLDVTDPEPPPPGSPMWTCPNLTITPHIAGALGRGRKSMGQLAIDELKRFFAGQSPLHPMTKDLLARMA